MSKEKAKVVPKQQPHAIPPELNPDLCNDPRRKKILMEIQALNTEYRELTKVKQQLIKKVQATDEEILKKIGAYQALKKVLATMDVEEQATKPADGKDDGAPEKPADTEPEDAPDAPVVEGDHECTGDDECVKCDCGAKDCVCESHEEEKKDAKEETNE